MRSIGLAYMGVIVVAVTLFLQGGAAEIPEAIAVSGRSVTTTPATPAPDATATRGPVAAVPSVAPAAPTAPPLPPTPPAAESASPNRVQEPPRSRSEPLIQAQDRSRPELAETPSRARFTDRSPSVTGWRAPDGPVRIGLQAGHWRADEAPRELSGLKSGGTNWRDTPEWRANLDIVRRAGRMLEQLGYEVDLLPAVVPPGYRAHLFISVHADGSDDPNASGYRVAAPRRDATGQAAQLARLLEDRYGEATGLRHIPTTTRRMRNYYAFNYRRYQHALHPMTIGVILETGFITSARDRRIILTDPDRAARGIVDAVASFPATPPPLVAEGR